ncbi:MAG TPA: 3-isopropylmalate dehydratase small subunit [Solirubrobacteraceae bacterium]|jgi:3-isopropylmalate/(R)-2-methylmalate dehydratase small subunit|nr:3-isopropylmalate dehydratase small subunit [Solirubrobacteraceae bacterium]
MEPITTIMGSVSVLDRADVDTDQIMPKQFLKRVERTGFGQYLFYDWAKEPGWDLPKNPILVTGRNFGCGSSREHAPWGLEDYGFKAVIAPSFADIFASNCMKIGLLPIALTEDEVAELMDLDPKLPVEIDLEAQEVRFDGQVATFEIDPETKHRLLNGLDDIAQTLLEEDAIAAYERDRERSGPVTTALA